MLHQKSVRKNFRRVLTREVFQQKLWIIANLRHLWFLKSNYSLFLQFLPVIRLLNIYSSEVLFNRHKYSDNRIPQNMCPADNLETHLLTRVVCTGHKFWRNVIFGKFLTINTALYDTKDVYNSLERGLTSRSRGGARKSNIFKFDDGGGWLWSNTSLWMISWKTSFTKMNHLT